MSLPDHVRAPRWCESGLRVWRADSWSRHEKPVRQMIDDAHTYGWPAVYIVGLIGVAVVIWAVT